jgi:hypothetical protein
LVGWCSEKGEECKAEGVDAGLVEERWGDQTDAVIVNEVTVVGVRTVVES